MDILSIGKHLKTEEQELEDWILDSEIAKKVYSGVRLDRPQTFTTSDGEVVHTRVKVKWKDVEGTLNPRTDLRSHSPTGFEWNYNGSGPSQLALAIMADFLEDDKMALSIYIHFRQDVIANLKSNEWIISGKDILTWLSKFYKQEGHGSELTDVERTAKT